MTDLLAMLEAGVVGATEPGEIEAALVERMVLASSGVSSPCTTNGFASSSTIVTVPTTDDGGTSVSTNSAVSGKEDKRVNWDGI